jgi:cytosine/adenosine deaminase-related metal-dependent hydrolase
MRQSTEEALRLTAETIAALAGRAGGRVSAWPLLIGFGTCSEALIRGAHALAERHGTGWGMMHFASHPSRKTSDTMPLAALDALGVLGPRTKLTHMVYVDDDDIATLARRGVAIAHCPTAALKHTKGLAEHGRFPEMLARGVTVSLGGDSGNGSNHFDMLRLMHLVALLYKDVRLDTRVMPPETVLEMATIHGAAALGLEREVGSLEPGKRADLVIYDLDVPEWRPLLDPVNNLVYAATGASVRTVVIDGGIVLDDGRITTIDERDVYRRVESLGRAQIARAGLPLPARWPVIG